MIVYDMRFKNNLLFSTKVLRHTLTNTTKRKMNKYACE